MAVRRPGLTFWLALALSVVILAAAGGGLWLWHQNGSLADANAQLQSDVAALRNPSQASGDSLAVGSGDGSVLGAGNTATSAGSSKTMQVKDFGIKFTIAADLADLTYTEDPPASGLLQLTTQALEKAFPQCAKPGILGSLFRYPAGQALPSSVPAGSVQNLPKAGNYNYYYFPLTQNPCQTNKAAVDAIAKTTEELKVALSTLTEQ